MSLTVLVIWSTPSAISDIGNGKEQNIFKKYMNSVEFQYIFESDLNSHP